MAKTLVYQLYPISWEKQGGLKAMAEHLEVINYLGADYVWLSPLYPSPRCDYGYDIADYQDIDSRLGTMADFERLLEECHKRGMECHAWMVTIPLGARRHMNSLGKQAVTSKQPGLALLYKGEYYLDPGNPKTKEYLMSLVNEVIQKYDVDGVHFDYLRYPEYLRQFPDQRQFRREAKGRNYAQWHRDNITEIVRYLYQGIKAQKPWVKVSTSPVGKSHDLTRYSSNSWNALETVSQDVQGWLGEGIQDQIYPMMYFRGNNFYPFALDWQEQSNGRQVIPGLGIYFKVMDRFSIYCTCRYIGKYRCITLLTLHTFRAEYHVGTRLKIRKSTCSLAVTCSGLIGFKTVTHCIICQCG